MSDRPGRLPEAGKLYLGSTARRRRQRQRGRRLFVLTICLLGLAAIAWMAVQSDGRPPDPARAAGTVRLVRDGKVVLERRVAGLRRLDDDELNAWLLRVPAARVQRSGRTTVSLRTNRGALRRAVRQALVTGGGTVRVVERPIASRVRLPIVKQALRNNCETAALSMLLVAPGVRADQLELQRQLPRSGPLDPGTAPDGTMLWGDPGLGFVGRPRGGGTAGGYGVYTHPIRALAARRGVHLSDLTRRRPVAVYRALLQGRPVMAWVGLSDGPYRTWRTPQGRTVTANLGEHTVVLTGIRGTSLEVNDPLVGERKTWSKAQFELIWTRLGRRALATGPVLDTERSDGA